MARKEKQPPAFTKERAKVLEQSRRTALLSRTVIAEPIATVEPPARVRTLPNGHMDPINAAKYLGRAVHTLAQWRCEGRGPTYVRVNGRIFYPKPGLDHFMAGELVTAAE